MQCPNIQHDAGKTVWKGQALEVCVAAGRSRPLTGRQDIVSNSRHCVVENKTEKGFLTINEIKHIPSLSWHENSGRGGQ